MLSRRFAVFTSMAAIVSACSIGALDGFTGGSSDAGPPDATPGVGTDAAASSDGPTTSDAAAEAAPVDAEAGVSDGLPPHGPNLFLNGGFEAAAAGWTPYNVVVVASSTARTGQSSLSICPSSGEYPLLTVKMPRAIVAGDRYYAEIYIRGADPSDFGSPGANVALYSQDGTEQEVAPIITSPPLSADWSRVQLLLTTTSNATELHFDVRLPSSTSPCILVDDAALYRLD